MRPSNRPAQTLNRSHPVFSDTTAPPPHCEDHRVITAAAAAVNALSRIMFPPTQPVTSHGIAANKQPVNHACNLRLIPWTMDMNTDSDVINSQIFGEQQASTDDNNSCNRSMLIDLLHVTEDLYQNSLL